MTRRVGNVVIIEDEPDKICARCKKLTDCRPFASDGSQICLDCSTKKERDAYAKKLFGDESN